MINTKIPLTKEQAIALTHEERKALINVLKKAIEPLNQELWLLEGTCKHVAKEIPVEEIELNSIKVHGKVRYFTGDWQIAPNFDTEYAARYYAADEWRSDSGHCLGCGANLGWYCPCHPDHICEYVNEKDGGWSENCKNCGMPSERK